ncbi:MAG: hypothetical protein JXR70_09035 [Spirochaetales bacterium]|nr:hypothetical protein [Spirochaetales bacterium]
MKLHNLIEEFMNKKIIEEGIVRDFLDDIAKGKYKYLIGNSDSRWYKIIEEVVFLNFFSSDFLTENC